VTGDGFSCRGSVATHEISRENNPRITQIKRFYRLISQGKSFAAKMEVNNVTWLLDKAHVTR
jgi:hypothetical protein